MVPVLSVTRKSDNAVETDDAPEAQSPEALFKAIDDEFGPKFEELEKSFESAKTAAEKAKEADDAETLKAKTDELDEVQKSLDTATAERDEALKNARVVGLEGRVNTLTEAIKAAREPHADFNLGSFATPEEQDAAYGPNSEHSFFVDAAKSFRHDKDAEQRWTEATTEKSMTQASGSTGGYLVPPQVSSELLRFREQQNILRPLFSRVQVDADVLRIAAQTKGLLAGWVAELAQKPESDLAFGEVSVNVFWKAGMAVVSNQLLRNSNPSIDGLIYSDLGKRLAALEEIAFISGSGNGQPLGILNTPGVQYTGDNESGGASDFSSTDVDNLLDEIINGITAIYTEYFGAPNAILMHPRTWARIVKARKEEAAATFMVGPPASASGGGRDATDPLPGYGQGANPTGTLFGLPVYTTRNVPTNAGDDDNESRVVIGNFSEGLILDHASVTLDASEHVYFQTNQTIFRAEDAVGFTAARYPKAFYVINGPGLANG